MSTPAVGPSTSGSPISITGLASGLDTTSIINALMAVEREPVVRMTAQQEKLQAGQLQLEGIRSSLRQLAFAVAEFRLSSAFESAQSVTTSDPTKIGATSTGGAGVGGYEVEVKQLASSAQRTFAFASPAAADTITIDGHEYTLKAGGSAKELASKINADSSATVYAAVVGTEEIVLSNRATGATGGEFIEVTDGGGTLTETGLAKEGKDAEYLVDGVAGTSASNTLTGAIAGITLTLTGLTSGGPVTIVVQPPGANVSAIETRLQEFATLYNSTVEAIEKQLTTKPLSNPGNATEAAVGMLFGDTELSGLLSRMRQSMYEPIKGLPVEMSSPLDIGISTGAGSGGGSSQGAVQGLLKLDSAKLASAVQANPAGAETMLMQWAKGLEGSINGVVEAGASMEARITGDSTQVSELKVRIATMNEMLAVRQKSLQQTYAQLEGIISRNTAQSNWLVSQSEQLTRQHL